MFISEAYAAAEPMMGDSSALGSTLVQLALILLIFYFLLIRPQQKRMKEHAAMVEALKVGDEVVTGSGIYGVIAKIDERTVFLNVDTNTTIRVDRMSINGVVEKQDTFKNKTKTSKTKKDKK